MKLWLRLGRPAAGVCLCAVTALVAATVAAHHPWRVFVPLGFVLFIVLLAARYGLPASVLGAAVAALIFAYFLFPPLGSLRVADNLERANLAWMVLAGIVIPFLLLAPAGFDKGHK